MQRILIDGYNLIHADEQLKAQLRMDISAARASLLARLATYAGRRKVRMTVVFDGAGGWVDSEGVLPGQLQVLFSASGQRADDVIVDILEGTANPRAYIVVTSDMTDIGRVARAMGTTVMSSPEFLDRLARSMDPDAGTSKPANDTAPGDDAPPVDVDYWMRMFRERDENAENEDDK